jgi:hypothetical protein
MYLWLFVIIGLGLYTFDGVEDIFSVFAGIFGTIGVFQRSDRMLRLICGMGTINIIAHNVLIGTPGGIALEAFFLGSNVFSYYRFYLKKK